LAQLEEKRSSVKTIIRRFVRTVSDCLSRTVIVGLRGAFGHFAPFDTTSTGNAAASAAGSLPSIHFRGDIFMATFMTIFS
jgi:hypothetical protein